MKNLNSTRTRVMGAALLAAFVGAPLVPAFTPEAQAQNRRGDRRDDDRRRDGSSVSYTGTVTNVRSGNSFDMSVDGRNYNVYTASSLPRDLSRGDRVSVRGNIYGTNDIRGARVSIVGDSRNDPRRDDRRGDGINYEAARTYRGTVEILLPNNEFNARVDGRIYKVYSASSTRDLRVGDSVEINGQMDRGVNIRNARITRLGDRNGNRGNGRVGDERPGYTRDRNGTWRYDPNGKIRDSYGTGRYGDRNGDRNRDDNRRDFATYTGVVTEVKNSREFRVRANGRDYDVYSDGSTRDLDRGDEVRVYGQLYGTNDIRDARVTITRNRDRNDDRFGGDSRDYRTYTGEVVSIKNSREFRVRANGREYDVYADSSTRGLDRGDEVRIYGRLYGTNDIRNANVRITRDR